MAKQVIKFYADWCNPCRMYGPIFEKVKQELQNEEFTFQEVNVEQDTENLSAKYKVRGIPHTVVVEDGEEIKSQAGALVETELKKFILN